MRVDYVLNDKTSASLRFNTDQYYNVSPALAENTYTTMDTPQRVLDVQHTFSPTMLNDARIGQNRDNYQDKGDGKSLYSLSITGFTGYSLGDHSYRKDNSYSFVDNLTCTRGRHTIQAGVEIRRMQENKLHFASLQSLTYLSESAFLAISSTPSATVLSRSRRRRARTPTTDISSTSSKSGRTSR